MRSRIRSERWTQLVLAGQRGDQTRVELLALRRAVHVVRKVGRHLEELREVGLEIGEQVVEHALAEKHDLHVEGDRLGLQRDGANQTQHISRRFELELARGQDPLQPFPGEGLEEDAPGIEQQVPPVGPVKRTGLHHREVGGQRSQQRLVLHPADQILISGILLVDHRRRLGLRMVDEHVHLIASEGVSLARTFHQRRHLGRHLLLRSGDELPHVLDHVRLDVVQVLQHFGERLVPRSELIEQIPHRVLRDLPVQGADLVPHLSLPPGHLAQHLLQLPLELPDARLDRFGLLIGKLVQILGGEHLPVPHGREREADRRSH
ncbi:MAG: hypothetical protein P8Y26_15505 [Gemmatimonadales bacterium]